MTNVSNVAKFVTYMTKNDALAPVIALEATVTGGRTLQAYKRGGEDEARERLIEESTGAVVWLGGVKGLNYLGDKVLKKYFGQNFDVGTDKVLRTPFDNFMSKYPPKNLSAKQVALIKAAKVLTSVVLADAFIGLVVPKINQGLTKKKTQEKQARMAKPEGVNNATQTNPTFKGSFSAINSFTNAIENSNTGKLLSTDAGLISGRVYSARNNDERLEIGIRDIGSIYFYLWAQHHVCNVMNYLEHGKFCRLNPKSTEILDDYLTDFLKTQNNEMNVEDFRKAVLGKKSSEIKLPEEMLSKFEKGELSWFDSQMNKFRKTKVEPLEVIKVDEVSKYVTDSEILQRIKEMSKLQPLRGNEAVVTKQQVIDAYNIAKINDPKLLAKVFGAFTGGTKKANYLDGKNTNPYKYVSNDSLYNLKAQMESYLETLCKKAKDGKVTTKLLEESRRKNLLFNGLNFFVGFAFAAAFLSTLIPKFQYWVTKQRTGLDEFPGMRDSDVKINKTA